MPALGIHIIIAEKFLEQYPNIHAIAPKIQTSDLLKRAYLFGSWGPDFLYYMVDNHNELQKFNIFFDMLNSNYDQVEEAIELYNWFREATEKVDQPGEAIKDFLSDGNIKAREELVRLKYKALISAAQVLLTDQRVTIKNPFASLNIPGVPNSADIEINLLQGPMTKFLRTFGHPYTKDVDPLLPPSLRNLKQEAPYAGDNNSNPYESGWWWVDILHYRRTGLFAEQLMKNAEAISDQDTKDLVQAYALGYWTHVAGDVTGHAYVNAVVGGPYRNHVIRHLTMENVMDSWAWKNYKGQDLINSEMDEMISLDVDEVYSIADVMIKTMNQVYIDKSQFDNFFPGDDPGVIRPELLPDSLPDRGDIYRSYMIGLLLLKKGTHQNLESPVRPPNPDLAGLATLNNELYSNLQNSFDSARLNVGIVRNALTTATAPEDIIIGSICGALWALATLAELLLYPVALKNRLAGMPKRWYYYYIQLALLNFIREMNWLMASNGFGKVSSFDLGRSFCKTCVEIPGNRAEAEAFNFPFVSSDHKKNFFWLEDPRNSVSLETVNIPNQQLTGVESCPYPKGSSPDVFIDKLINNISVRPDTAFGAARNPAETLSIQHQTFSTMQLTNAIELAHDLVSGAYPVCSFDLDSDRGYGFLSWERDKDNNIKYTI